MIFAVRALRIVFLGQLPDSPTRYMNYGSLNSVRSFPTKDSSEFYAVQLKSGIINPNHPKLVFDEDTFLIFDSDIDIETIELKIYSNLNQEPQIIKLEVNKNEALKDQIK